MDFLAQLDVFHFQQRDGPEELPHDRHGGLSHPLDVCLGLREERLGHVVVGSHGQHSHHHVSVEVGAPKSGLIFGRSFRLLFFAFFENSLCIKLQQCLRQSLIYLAVFAFLH